MKPLKKIYRRKRHSVSLLHAHLVFTSKYRRRVMTWRVFDILRRSMQQTAQQLDVEIIAIEADGDHLHLMIAHPPTSKLCEIVRRMKGPSSRRVRQKRLPEVLNKLWGAAFWSPSYFVVSCGGAPLDVVKTYVENQQSPGRNRRTQPIPSVRPIRKNTLHPRTEVRG